MALLLSASNTLRIAFVKKKNSESVLSEFSSPLPAAETKLWLSGGGNGGGHDC